MDNFAARSIDEDVVMLAALVPQNPPGQPGLAKLSAHVLTSNAL